MKIGALQPADAADLILAEARDREMAILVAAYPNRMRAPMVEDLIALAEVLEG